VRDKDVWERHVWCDVRTADCIDGKEKWQLGTHRHAQKQQTVLVAMEMEGSPQDASKQWTLCRFLCGVLCHRRERKNDKQRLRKCVEAALLNHATDFAVQRYAKLALRLLRDPDGESPDTLKVRLLVGRLEAKTVFAETMLELQFRQSETDRKGHPSMPVASTPMTFTLNNNGLRVRQQISISSNMKVSEFKEHVSRLTGVPCRNQILVHSGRPIIEGTRIGAYNITAKSIVHLVSKLRFRGGADQEQQDLLAAAFLLEEAQEQEQFVRSYIDTVPSTDPRFSRRLAMQGADGSEGVDDMEADENAGHNNLEYRKVQRMVGSLAAAQAARRFRAQTSQFQESLATLDTTLIARAKMPGEEEPMWRGLPGFADQVDKLMKRLTGVVEKRIIRLLLEYEENLQICEGIERGTLTTTPRGIRTPAILQKLKHVAPHIPKTSYESQPKTILLDLLVNQISDRLVAYRKKLVWTNTRPAQAQQTMGNASSSAIFTRGQRAARGRAGVPACGSQLYSSNKNTQDGAGGGAEERFLAGNVIRTILGDGNCFYTCLATCLHPEQRDS